MGYEEVVSNILVSKNMLRDKMNIHEQPLVEVANVMNESYAVLRDAILPSLLEVESHSGSALYPHRIFEVGEIAVFNPEAPHGSDTQSHLGAVMAHNKVTLSEIHADLEFLFQQLGLTIEPSKNDHPSFLPGRAANIILQGQPAGIVGEVHPLVLEKWDIVMPVLAFEININALL
jgi:phenylalanyl-tRNA synthetase beta chain